MKYFNRVLSSDINPFEVIEEKTDRLIIIREMKSELLNPSDVNNTFVPGGFFGHFDNSIQKWDISSHNDGCTMEIRLHKNGQWKDRFGVRYIPSDEPVKKYDFNF